MSNSREILSGSIRRAVTGARLIARTDPETDIHVTVVLARRNNIDRARLREHALARPHERPATDHAGFARDYGASEASMGAMRVFADKYGLRITQTDVARRVVELSGSVADMERAFGTELHDCEFETGASGARAHSAESKKPVYRGRRGPILLPTAVLPHVVAVLGLDNRPVARPKLRPRGAGISYTPKQLATLYGFPSGMGVGQTIALIELSGNYSASDLAQYFAGIGSAAPPTVRAVNVGGAVPAPYGQDPNSDGEVMLDIEVVGGIAPEAAIVVYFAANTDEGFYQAASLAVHDPATTAVSISWGSPEKDWSAQSMDAWNSLGQTATLLNVPIFVAAGDHGCADEMQSDAGFDSQRHADFPGTCRDGVISCGGTALQVNPPGLSETVWNNANGWATGGGVSAYFQAPEWQSGLSAEGGSPLLMRGIPDVAGVADPQTGIQVLVHGAPDVTGGTSAVAPQWAALTALLSEQLSRKAGFFLPLLYQHSGTTRDVVSGNNTVFGVEGYVAQAGWNACTGLGSPDGQKLLALLGGGAQPGKPNAGGEAGAAGPDGGDGQANANPPPDKVAGAVSPIALARTGSPFDARAATLYGQLIVAAYSMYNANPHNRTPAPTADFPAGYELAAWIQMEDFLIGSLGPTFYGFIARSIANPSAFILALRGTSNGVEWWDDANAVIRKPFRVPNCGSVGSGFARIYDTLEVIECATGQAAAAAAARSLRSIGTFSQQVAALVSRHAAANARAIGMPAAATVEVTGHSLGAALATLYTLENATTDKVSSLALCTFASPLVGDSDFVAAFNGLGLTSWRVVNQPDVVPKLPPEIFGFRHVDTQQLFNSSGKVKSSVGCWHAMATYLSLVNPTLQPGASCCPNAAAAVAPATLARDAVQSISVPAGNVTVNITLELTEPRAAG